METILVVNKHDLDRLSAEEAVDVFRELLWAEATSLDIAKNLINVPTAITVKDGGIDAEVKNVEIQGGQGIIKKGLTRYQIKTGDFSLSGDSKIKEILFKTKTTELKSRVKSCLDKNGTLIVVLFGWDDPQIEDNQLTGRFRTILEKVDKQYKTAEIEVWQQNNIISFLKAYPSLALRVNGRSDLLFRTHNSWSRDAEMRRVFKAGEEQEDLISSIQKELRKNTEAVHIRVLGEPGIGKTRLVLEATRAIDLHPLVAYCRSGSLFRDSRLMNEIFRDDNQFHVLLVIDECEQGDSAYMWNIFKYLGPRIKIISIYTEYERTSGNILPFNVPLLHKEQVSNIIQEYGVAEDQAERWSELCGGSPRVAHALGWNLSENPEDLLRSPDTVDIWERYIVGYDNSSDAKVAERRTILQHVALFRRFGYSRPVIIEAQAVAKLIERANPQITWSRFEQAVSELMERRILQGEYTLYITPKALHIKLWVDWWQIHGKNFILEDFKKDLPPKLLEWFYDMFKYAAESEVASQIVQELLGPEGPFRDDNYLQSMIGARFFFALADAKPQSALNYLKGTIGTWSKDELLKFTTGRREVLWSLEKMAMRKETFVDAARLLLKLGEAENESYGNNASGVFAQLFSPAPGEVAPTEASPQERFPILKEAITSNSKERRLLALKACDQGLKTEHFIRTIGLEHQGLREKPKFWTPKTYGELFDAYRQVWNLLREQLDSLPEDEQQEAVDILLRHVRGLGRIGNLVDMVIETVTELSSKSYVDNRKILAHVIPLIDYEKQALPDEILERWEQIRDNLTRRDFPSLLKRYVGMSYWETGHRDIRSKQKEIDEQIQEIAKQASEDKGKLRDELPWLMSEEAKEGHRFGYVLGREDKGFTLLSELLEAQKKVIQKSSIFFLSGYFQAMYELDPEKWETYLDAVSKDEQLRICLPELTWRSGISDRASMRVLKLAEENIIDVCQFRTPIYGGLGVNESAFRKWITFLLRYPKPCAVYIAIDWVDFYYLRKESTSRLPKKMTFDLLTHKSLFAEVDMRQRGQLDDYHWTEIAKKHIELYPEKALEIAEFILGNFGKDGTIFDSYSPEPNKVLNKIAGMHPKETWHKVTKYLGPPIDERAFHIRGWLRGGNIEAFDREDKDMLSVFPPADVWAWVDQDVDKRAWYLASFVPKKLFRREDEICFAREILVRYGEREDVRSNLLSNFMTGVSWGRISENFLSKKNQLLKFKEQEDNENVKRWLDEYIYALDQEIEGWKIEEEREDL